jgi:hypothetical protein
MTPAELRALAKRVCEEQPSRELDAEIAFSVGAYDRLSTGLGDARVARVRWCADFDSVEVTMRPPGRASGGLIYTQKLPAYTTSLDAAVMLMPKRWVWHIRGVRGDKGAIGIDLFPPIALAHLPVFVSAPTEPQARVAAALLARAADMEASDV